MYVLGMNIALETLAKYHTLAPDSQVKYPPFN